MRRNNNSPRPSGSTLRTAWLLITSGNSGTSATKNLETRGRSVFRCSGFACEPRASVVNLQQSNLHHPEKLEDPSRARFKRFDSCYATDPDFEIGGRSLRFGAWSFSGCWALDFGCYTLARGSVALGAPNPPLYGPGIPLKTTSNQEPQ